MIVVKVPHLYKRNIRSNYKSHVKDIGEYQIRISDNWYYSIYKKTKCKGGWYPDMVMIQRIDEGRDLVDRLNKDAKEAKVPLTFAWE